MTAGSAFNASRKSLVKSSLKRQDTLATDYQQFINYTIEKDSDDEDLVDDSDLEKQFNINLAQAKISVKEHHRLASNASSAFRMSMRQTVKDNEYDQRKGSNKIIEKKNSKALH